MREKLLLAGLVVGLCSLGQAQSSNTKGQTPTTQSQEKSTGADQNRGQTGQGQSATTGSEQETSITGCLQRGSGSSYTITDAAGKKHDIKASSSSVKLDDHVGHRVTVKTGSESGADRAGTNSNRGGAGQTAELNVTSLTMVSTSCQ
jgi:hypothetical protein